MNKWDWEKSGQVVVDKLKRIIISGAVWHKTPNTHINTDTSLHTLAECLSVHRWVLAKWFIHKEQVLKYSSDSIPGQNWESDKRERAWITEM